MLASILTTLQKRSTLIYVTLMASFLLLFQYHSGIVHTNIGMIMQLNGSYLIYTEKCQILDLDAWNSDAKRFYKKKSYFSCWKLPLLTRIVLADNKTDAYLIVNEDLIHKYSKEGVTCCVSDVNRGTGDKIDNNVIYSKCRPMHNNKIAIPNDRPSKVSCHSKGRKKNEVYANAHMPFAATKRIQAKKLNFKSERRPLSILLLGIDSLSRLNFIRTMPKTRAVLASDPNWIEFKVYNKVGDNTFPNFMAMLAGLNSTRAYSLCEPQTLGGLDTCSFLWQEFSERNYITAYAEDSAGMSTFNYNKKGFSEPPTDFYMRSYQLACKSLNLRSLDSTSSYCSGPEIEGERVWRLARDFASTYNDTPTFGFFWANTFSHQMLNTPTRMDAVIAGYLANLTAIAANDSLIIFLSDHGIRFGDIRYTLTGYIEERMPVAYFRFPTWFQAEFAEEFETFLENRNHLVSPYDVYVTLQDILTYSGFKYEAKMAEGCPTCGSLFRPVEANRACQDAGIPLHYCTCNNFYYVDPVDWEPQRAAKLVIDQLHENIAQSNMTRKCRRFNVRKVVGAYKSRCNYELDGYYLVVLIKTSPAASFEATMLVRRKANVAEGSTMASQDQFVFEIMPGVSRVDSYSSTGKCASGAMKLYCICK